MVRDANCQLWLQFKGGLEPIRPAGYATVRRDARMRSQSRLMAQNKELTQLKIRLSGLHMDKGHIIFLNGNSSSGKTTIAKALQESLSEPYMHLSGDDFIGMYPQWIWGPKGGKEMYLRFLPAIISGLHGCVAALASSGNHIILDHVLQEKEWLKECVEKWAGLDVLFVGIKCPLEIVEQREQGRRDRNIGTARSQYECVHSHELYDLEVDTSILTVEECVARITEVVKKKPPMTAFDELATRFGEQKLVAP